MAAVEVNRIADSYSERMEARERERERHRAILSVLHSCIFRAVNFIHKITATSLSQRLINRLPNWQSDSESDEGHMRWEIELVNVSIGMLALFIRYEMLIPSRIIISSRKHNLQVQSQLSHNNNIVSKSSSFILVTLPLVPGASIYPICCTQMRAKLIPGVGLTSLWDQSCAV